MKHIALVTYSKEPALSVSDQQLAAALERLYGSGIEVNARAWDDTTVNWNDFDIIIIRSCWNYYEHAAAFTGWLDTLEAAKCNVWNPVPVIKWNMHKTYLEKLANAVIPRTLFCSKGQVITDIDLTLKNIGWNDNWDKLVAKPAVAASGNGTMLIRKNKWRDDLAAFNLAIQEKDMMIQEYLEAVAATGEYSLVFFDKVFSHAVLKKVDVSKDPLGFRINSQFGGFNELHLQPDAAMLAAAQAILDAIPEPLLYARIDGIMKAGQFILMELELIEPGLFLNLLPNGHAAEAFAKAVGGRLFR